MYVLLFSATLVTYQVQDWKKMCLALFGFWSDKSLKKTNVIFLFNLKNIFYFVLSLSILGSLFFLNFWQCLFLLHLGFIAIFYGISFGKIKPLRQIRYLKIFLVAYTWAATTVLFPNLDLFAEKRLWYWFFSQFLFFFALILAFDIRDRIWDKKQNLRTLVQKIGVRASKFLAGILLVLSSFLAFQISETLFLTSILSHTLGFILIFFASEKRSLLYFLFGLDGIFLWQYIFYWILKFND